MRILYLCFCSLLLSVGPAWSAAQDQPSANKGRIAGRVVYADNGHPVRRVLVHCGLIASAPTPADGKIVRQPAPAIFGFVTDMNGKWAGELPAGEYRAWAVALNLVNYADTPPPDAVSFTVRANGVTDTEIAAQRGGVITGRVLYPDGAGVGGAKLKLFRRNAAKTWQIVSAIDLNQLIADRTGTYRLTGLPAGRYAITATEPDIQTDPLPDEATAYSKGGFVTAFYPSARHIDQAKSIKVELGRETEGLDITLPGQVYRVGGSIMFAGTPIPSALVIVQALDEQPNPPKDDHYTNQQGGWQFNGLPEGKYKLDVSLPEDARNATHGEAIGWETEFTVTADRTDWRIELPVGARVSGLVEWAGKRPLGKLTEWVKPTLQGLSQGVTPPNAAAQANDDDNDEDDDDAETDDPYSADECAANGAFIIKGLPTGWYQFDGASEENNAYLTAVLINGQDVTTQPLELKAGQDLTDIRLVFADDFATVSGRVYLDAAQKKPISEDGSVIFLPVDRTRRAVKVANSYAQTDEKGAFTAKLPPGEYYVVAAERFLSALELEKNYWPHRARLPRLTVAPNAKITRWNIVASADK